MSGVTFRRRKRWPGTRGEAAWLLLKRAAGGAKAARLALIPPSWSDNVWEGLKLLQQQGVSLEGGYLLVEKQTHEHARE